MRKIPTKLAAAVACALLLALAIATFALKDTAGVASTKQLGSKEEAAGHCGEVFFGSERALEQKARRRSDRPAELLRPNNERSVSGPTPLVTQEAGHAGEIQAEQKRDLNEDVVGRPFPLSPSVMRTCGSRMPDRTECPRLMEFLVEFERESRNDAWARDMEGRLAKALHYPDPGKYSLRRIECRSNRCFAEVSAPYEWNLGDLDNFPDLTARLFGPVVGDLGFEAGPNGEKVIVTALGFERR